MKDFYRSQATQTELKIRRANDAGTSANPFPHSPSRMTDYGATGGGRASANLRLFVIPQLL